VVYVVVYVDVVPCETDTEVDVTVIVAKEV